MPIPSSDTSTRTESFTGLGLELDDAALWRVLDGVREQVPDHLAEPVWVSDAPGAACLASSSASWCLGLCTL